MNKKQNKQKHSMKLAVLCTIAWLPVGIIGYIFAFNSISILFFTTVGAIICLPLGIVAIIKVATATSTNDWEKSHQASKISSKCSFIGLFALICLVAIAIIVQINRSKEFKDTIRLINKGSLKRIAHEMQMYAYDNNGYFPDQLGVKGLSQLMSANNLYSSYFIDMRDSDGYYSASEKLTDTNTDYIYVGAGLTKDSHADVPIIFEKPWRDTKPILYVFSDGHVSEYIGPKTIVPSNCEEAILLFISADSSDKDYKQVLLNAREMDKIYGK